MMKNTPPQLAVQMARNQPVVWEFQQAVSQVSYCFTLPPKLLRMAIKEGALAAYDALVDGEWRTIKPVSFRAFIEAPCPEGCGTTVELFRRSLAGSDVADRFESMLEGGSVSDVDVDSLHPGRLASNGMTIVSCLQPTLAGMPTKLERALAALRDVIASEAWRSFHAWGGKPVFHSEFRRFLQAPISEGCGVDPEVARKVAAGSDLADEVDRLLGISTAAV